MGAGSSLSFLLSFPHSLFLYFPLLLSVFPLFSFFCCFSLFFLLFFVLFALSLSSFSLSLFLSNSLSMARMASLSVQLEALVPCKSTGCRRGLTCLSRKRTCCFFSHGADGAAEFRPTKHVDVASLRAPFVNYFVVRRARHRRSHVLEAYVNQSRTF